MNLFILILNIQMTSLNINDIPYNDIKRFLSDNNLFVPTDKAKAYIAAKNLIDLGKIYDGPDSVLDFIIATELSIQSPELSKYSMKFILNASEDELVELSCQLMLSIIEKEKKRISEA